MCSAELVEPGMQNPKSKSNVLSNVLRNQWRSTIRKWFIALLPTLNSTLQETMHSLKLFTKNVDNKNIRCTNCFEFKEIGSKLVADKAATIGKSIFTYCGDWCRLFRLSIFVIGRWTGRFDYFEEHRAAIHVTDSESGKFNIKYICRYRAQVTLKIFIFILFSFNYDFHALNFSLKRLTFGDWSQIANIVRRDDVLFQ